MASSMTTLWSHREPKTRKRQEKISGTRYPCMVKSILLLGVSQVEGALLLSERSMHEQ